MFTVSEMSPNFQSHYFQTQIAKLEDEISEAKTHINLVRTIGESNAINYYPQPHHRPVQHPKHGKISPVYAQYVYYKKQLPEWESKLQNYKQQFSLFLSSFKK